MFFLRKNNENKKIFKETIDMPILEDFYNILGEDEKTKKYQIKLLPFVKGSLNFFNKFTNVKLNNKLIAIKPIIPPLPPLRLPIFKNTILYM